MSSAQGLAHLHLSLPLTLFLDDMLNGTLGGLFSAAVYHDKFNPLESAARSMAVFAAQKAAQSLEKAKHPRKVQEPEEPARTAMMQDAKSAGYALKLPVAFIDDPIDMAEQAYATGTDSSGELLPKAGQQAANSSFFGHQSYAVTVPFTARQQQKEYLTRDAYQHSLRQWQARQVRQAHVSADNSSLGHGNLVNSQRAQALTTKEVQGWLYTLATSQWEQTASPSTQVHESWWNTMKFGLLESLHEEANLVREYVQKPLLEGLESTLSGVSYIADELAPVFLNTPYTVSEGAALEELALGTARVAHFFGETAKNSALIRRIGLFGRGVETDKLFVNQFPEHLVDRSNIIPTTQLKNINGRFNYVVDENKNLIVGRVSKNIGGGHIDLASGKPVQAAGEVRVINGQIKYFDNSSGHYLPTGTSAQQAAEEAFSNLGFDTYEKYIEKQWIEDLNHPNGGAWRPNQ